LIAGLDESGQPLVLQTAISSLIASRIAVDRCGRQNGGWLRPVIKQPTAFLRAAAAEAGLKLAPLFAAGLGSSIGDSGSRAQARKSSSSNCNSRKVGRSPASACLPVDPQACGPEALKDLADHEQVFVQCGRRPR